MAAQENVLEGRHLFLCESSWSRHSWVLRVAFWGASIKPSYPLVKCPGALELYEPGLEKVELYGPIAPGFV